MIIVMKLMLGEQFNRSRKLRGFSSSPSRIERTIISAIGQKAQRSLCSKNLGRKVSTIARRLVASCSSRKQSY